MRPGVTIPPVDLLSPIPIDSHLGTCMTADPNSVNPNIYCLFPAVGGATAQFWSYNTDTNGWFRLTDATAGGNRVYTITCLCFDYSGGVIWLGTAATAAPWAQILRYTIATDTWAVMAQAGGTFAAAGVAASWNTVMHIAHPCTGVGGAASDDFLYFVGNGAQPTYSYRISTDAVAALANVGGNVVSGSFLAWFGRTPDLLFSAYGGGAANIRQYTIAGNAWGALALVPPLTFPAGSEVWADESRTAGIVHQAGRLYDASFVAQYFRGAGTLHGTDGTQYASHGITTRVIAGKKYAYVMYHSYGAGIQGSFQRFRIVE